MSYLQEIIVFSKTVDAFGVVIYKSNKTIVTDIKGKIHKCRKKQLIYKLTLNFQSTCMHSSKVPNNDKNNRQYTNLHNHK